MNTILIFVLALALPLAVMCLLKLLKSRKKRLAGRNVTGNTVKTGIQYMRPEFHIEEIPASEPSSPVRDETLRNVFERLEGYFLEERPYLDGNMTIDAVAKSLYTNKAYVSRAVKKYSGLNFCQYVNRYRVHHAMETYRLNPGLRMNELAQMSGFNSVTSFNISFRAFMDEAPGSWSRKFRMRLRGDGMTPRR